MRQHTPLRPLQRYRRRRRRRHRFFVDGILDLSSTYSFYSIVGFPTKLELSA